MQFQRRRFGIEPKPTHPICVLRPVGDIVVAWDEEVAVSTRLPWREKGQESRNGAPPVGKVTMQEPPRGMFAKVQVIFLSLPEPDQIWVSRYEQVIRMIGYESTSKGQAGGGGATGRRRWVTSLTESVPCGAIVIPGVCELHFTKSVEIHIRDRILGAIFPGDEYLGFILFIYCYRHVGELLYILLRTDGARTGEGLTLDINLLRYRLKSLC